MPIITTALLTSFTGSDEAPISEGGNWTGPTNTSWQRLRRISNACAKTTPVTANAAGDYWAATNFGADQEAWVTLTDYAAGEALWVSARLQNPGNAATQTHYHAQWNGTNFSIIRFVGTSNTTLGSVAGSMSVGDKIGIQCIGTTIRLLHFTGGTWIEKISVQDTTINGPGYIGAGLYALSSSGTIRIDDFGGGTVVPTFPTTPILTTFTGPDEDPLSEGGLWLGSARVPSAAIGPCRRTNNAAAQGGAVSTTSESCWATNFSADQEAYLTIATLPQNSAYIELYLRIQNRATIDVALYTFTYTVGTGLEWHKLVSNTWIQIGTTFSTIVLAEGDRIGARIRSSTLEGFYNVGGGWLSVGTVEDTSVSGAGLIGFALASGSAVADNFGGGIPVFSSGDNPPFGMLGRGAGL